MYELIFGFVLLYKQETNEKGNNIKCGNDINYGLIAGGINSDAIHSNGLTEIVYNPVGKLIAGKSCKCPSGQGDAVNGTDVGHAVMVGQ